MFSTYADLTAYATANAGFSFLASVIDATGDPTVASGSATYVVNGSDAGIKKIAENESKGVVDSLNNSVTIHLDKDDVDPVSTVGSVIDGLWSTGFRVGTEEETKQSKTETSQPLMEPKFVETDAGLDAALASLTEETLRKGTTMLLDLIARVRPLIEKKQSE